MYKDVHMGDDENSMHVHICHKKKHHSLIFMTMVTKNCDNLNI
jgi:hypothetical protein